MTETVIVNRTPETFGQRRERERLEAAEVIHPDPDFDATLDRWQSGPGDTPADEIKAPAVAVVTRTANWMTAEAHNTPLTGKVDPVPDMAALDAAAAKLANALPSGATLLQRVAYTVLEAAIDELPAPGDIAKFKLQVVAAFKHLGLDTRKFFEV
jgi:hypothetical protein